MNAHPLLRQLLIITFISGAVLLSFKYVLPLIFPFLFAYTLMRSLMPISNTTPKGATPSDPFWEKAEGLFLQSIFYYVWLEVQPAKRNFETVLKLLGEAEVTEQGKASKLDVRMKFLEIGRAHV